MIILPQRSGYARRSFARTPLDVMLRRLGLAKGLLLCLDAGDAASYTSGQSWLDRSGNGYDFFLGGTGGAEASDPTFTGTAGGLSAGEYFAHDGGDFFRYDSSNEAWMNALHQDSAKFTMVSWFYPAAGGASGLFGTGTGVANHGVSFAVNSLNGNVNLQVFNGTGTQALVSASNQNVAGDAWQMFGLAIDEAAGTGLRVRNNSDIASFASTYTSPSAVAATSTLEICAFAASTIARSGSRMAAFAMLSETWTQAQFAAFYNASRARFSV